MIRKIEVERFTLSSSKPFDQVVAALNSAVGHPDMSEFWKSKPGWYIVATKARTVHPDLERFVAKRMGATTTEIESSRVPCFPSLPSC